MKMLRVSAALTASILALTACNPPEGGPPEPTVVNSTPGAVARATQTLPPTASPEPSLTPKPAPLPLEIVEWTMWADVPGYPRLEVLVRNPNQFPVKVNMSELSLLNGAGEIVRNTGDVFYWIWADAGWGLILPGETVPATPNLYPTGDDGPVAEWESVSTIRLVAELEETSTIPYTSDLQVSLGEFRSDLNFVNGADLDISNSSGQLLSSVLLRLIARNDDGEYLGVEPHLVFEDLDEVGNPVKIQPGASWHTIFLPTLTREPPQSMNYEITAIGLVAPE